jgi:hypothetical protein
MVAFLNSLVSLLVFSLHTTSRFKENAKYEQSTQLEEKARQKLSHVLSAASLPIGLLTTDTLNAATG